MVKQRKSRVSDVGQSVDEANSASDKVILQKSKPNGVLDEMEHDTNETAENGMSESPKNKKLKSRTLGQLVEQQRGEKDAELPHPSGSLAVQMTQGLMSNDVLKLDSVLRESRLEIIQATLVDLQVSHIVPLLKALFERISSRSAVNIRPWILWIQCILSLHASYLSSLRNLETELSGLLEWMRQRVGHQQKLLELYGRLSIVSEQIERRINRTVVVAPQPLIVFNDDVDSDLEDLESGGSDESGVSSDEEEEDWWEEEGIGAGNEDEDDDESDDDSDVNIPVKKVRGSGDGSDDDDDDDNESENGASDNNDDEDGDSDDEEMDIG
ncbi:NUC189 domain protein [Ancylostoma caninum]|uniref:NUC189 domain protein n=1 Tax=Ancylostoma caninum TaxID=29170 RepID=A0A368G8N2_ANCCA|nr:NUC189 domain protein [Ancylostoma caninum]